ncbi:AraC family transcriptional regulator [Spirosoma sp. KNUC1025]|uniref:AraC family transcriptional regulator n=1 Tax=Spirosoma sp. KNUC1025 TaxID=2894082 RepID=UPI001E649FCD|nr:AraC family transcriptional regulator [Spirosoma sp. KNUC1025]UFH57950.1 AraC family transcriptional regulator [Spirosoma sp. KNUC1025]
MSPLTRKSRGFAGERIIEVPKETVDKCLSMPLISSLFITRMGFYPKALYHYYQRPTGISQVILLYCTDGQGWIQLAKNRIMMQAGDVFAITPDTPHSYGADTDNPWTIHWFHFSGTDCHDVISAIMDDKSNLPQAVRVPYSDERIALFDRMFDTFLKGYSTSNLLFANLTIPFFLASFILPENFQKEIIGSGTATPTNRAILYMQNNLSSSITLDNIAQSVNLSTSFFSRKFRQDTGYAPIEYFNHLRIQKACQLLHFSDLRINEVAYQLGIDDPFYFSRLFKKQMGVSPAEYRKTEGIQRRV